MKQVDIVGTNNMDLWDEATELAHEHFENPSDDVIQEIYQDLIEKEEDRREQAYDSWREENL